MKDSLPFISIITLNYNQAHVTCEFLDSCKALTYPNYEIIVCDMNSKEDPSDLINEGHYPNVSLYLCDSNLGFAGGNNWGMSFAKGDYILIINNDTVVPRNLLEMLLIPFQLDPKIGVVCPKINFFYDKKRIQYAGFNPMNRITGRTKAIGNNEIDYGQFDEIRPTWGAHGAAMMVRRAIIETVGRFPETFFLYYEEWDWSTRILDSGYKIYFQGLATVYHKESASVGNGSPMKEYYLTRNRILFMRRNSKGYKLVLFSFFFITLTLPKNTLQFLIRGNFKFLKAFYKGIIDNFVMSSYSSV